MRRELANWLLNWFMHWRAAKLAGSLRSHSEKEQLEWCRVRGCPSQGLFPPDTPSFSIAVLCLRHNKSEAGMMASLVA